MSGPLLLKLLPCFNFKKDNALKPIITIMTTASAPIPLPLILTSIWTKPNHHHSSAPSTISTMTTIKHPPAPGVRVQALKKYSLMASPVPSPP